MTTGAQLWWGFAGVGVNDNDLQSIQTIVLHKVKMVQEEVKEQIAR